MERIRVLLVEDSLTVRARLREGIEEDESFEVVGEACDGREAVERCHTLRPHVVSLDMELPGLDGVEVTRQIMSDCATPILLVSASVNRGSSLSPFDALEAGAVELFDKAQVGRKPRWAADLRAMLRRVSRIRVISRPRLRGARVRSEPEAKSGTTPLLQSTVPWAVREPDAVLQPNLRVVAIGASTGGPAALARIFSAIPATFPLPILVVLHVSLQFGDMLVDWLGGQSKLPVVMASDGMRLPASGAPGGVFLAPPDRHTVLSEGKIRLVDSPEVNSCRPSADVLLRSAAREYGARAIGCILTGMGADGARGLQEMRAAGAITVAQDEASCVVFGMPKAAIALGAAELVRSLEEMAPTLEQLARAGLSRSVQQ